YRDAHVYSHAPPPHLDDLPISKQGRLSPNALGMQPRRAMWQLMLGGVFDRYPRLKLAMTEIRAEWLPETLDILDAKLAASGTRIDRKRTRLKSSHVISRSAGFC